jgi:hypothetical protein
MSSLPNVAPALADTLSGPIEVGDPDMAHGLTVYPLIGPPAALDYVAFASVHDQVAITELDGGASVNDLTVMNDSGKPVLLYEGEEILGAQQNRVLDVSVLIAAGAKIGIPVSCVERGRWDGLRHRERFRPSPQTADPKMRRLKSKRARVNADAGREARADQAEVWDEVDARGFELRTTSPTAAMHDVFEGHRERLAEIGDAIDLHDGQCGSVAVIGGRITILDFVGRADVYAVLHPAIVEGYALDALGHERRGDARRDSAVDAATVRGFTLLACDSPAASPIAGAGLGATVRFAGGGVEGSALVHGGELVQMTAFPSDADEEPAGPGPRAHRVSRPSRRSGRQGR